jgi:hypothetical protein
MEIVKFYFKQAPTQKIQWSETKQKLEERLAIPSGSEGYVSDEEDRDNHQAQIAELTGHIDWVDTAISSNDYTVVYSFTDGKGNPVSYEFDMINPDSKLGAFGKAAGQKIVQMHEDNVTAISAKVSELTATENAIHSEETVRLNDKIAKVNASFDTSRKSLISQKDDEIRNAIDGLFQDVTSEHPDFFNSSDYTEEVKQFVENTVSGQENVFSNDNTALITSVENLYNYYGNTQDEKSKIAEDNLDQAEEAEKDSQRLEADMSSSYDDVSVSLESAAKKLQKVIDIRGMEATITDAEYTSDLDSLKEQEKSGEITPTEYFDQKRELDVKYTVPQSVNDSMRRMSIRMDVVPSSMFTAVGSHSIGFNEAGIAALNADAFLTEAQARLAESLSEKDKLAADEAKNEEHKAKSEAEFKEVEANFEVVKAKRDAAIKQLTTDKDAAVGEAKLPIAEDLLKEKMHSIQHKMSFSTSKLAFDLLSSKLGREGTIIKNALAEYDVSIPLTEQCIALLEGTIVRLSEIKAYGESNRVSSLDMLASIEEDCIKYDNNTDHTPAMADLINRLEGGESVFPNILDSAINNMTPQP